MSTNISSTYVPSNVDNASSVETESTNVDHPETKADAVGAIGKESERLDSLNEDQEGDHDLCPEVPSISAAGEISVETTDESHIAEEQSTIVDLPDTPIDEVLAVEKKRGEDTPLTDEEQKERDSHLGIIANSAFDTLTVALAMFALDQKRLLRRTAEFCGKKDDFVKYMIRKFDFQRAYIFVMLKAARIYTKLSDYLPPKDLPIHINALMALDGYSVKTAVTAIREARRLYSNARHITSTMIINALDKCPEYRKKMKERADEKERREITRLDLKKIRSGLKDLKTGAKALYYMNPTNIPVDAYTKNGGDDEKEFAHEVALREVYDEIGRAVRYFEVQKIKGEEHRHDVKFQRRKIWDDNGTLILFKEQKRYDKWEQKNDDNGAAGCVVSSI